MTGLHRAIHHAPAYTQMPLAHRTSSSDRTVYCCIQPFAGRAAIHGCRQLVRHATQYDIPSQAGACPAMHCNTVKVLPSRKAHCSKSCRALKHLLAFVAFGDDQKLPDDEQVDFDGAFRHFMISSLHSPIDAVNPCSCTKRPLCNVPVSMNYVLDMRKKAGIARRCSSLSQAQEGRLGLAVNAGGSQV